MKTLTTTLSIMLAGLLGAPVVAVGVDTGTARTTDRAPQQVAALMRGFAAGNGWAIAEEVTLRGRRSDRPAALPADRRG